MQLIHILAVAFAVLANAQRYNPYGHQYHQKRAAQAVGSNNDFNTGSDSASNPGSNSTSGSGTTGNDASNAASSSPSQSSTSSTSNTNSASSSPSQSSTSSTSNTNSASSSPSQSSTSSTSNTNSDCSSSSSSTNNNNNNAVGSAASFTQYGPCNSPSLTSCEWYSSTGYNAAISQAVYGGSPGSGPSAACGTCWKLTPDNPSANEIVVKVNNLCPDVRNPLCAQAADVNINFDLCEDSGAAADLFGSTGTQQVNGTAVMVNCCEWNGGADVN